MTGNKYVWLRTSLFYGRHYWEHLLTNGVRPFLERMQESQYLNRFMIYFNGERGDNIRIVFEVLSGEENSFLVCFENYFATHLQANPSQVETRAVVSREPSSIFCNLPNNSIQYNIFEDLRIQTESVYLEEICIFRARFSETILQIAEDAPFGLVSTFSIAVLLHMLMIRYYIMDIDALYSLFEQLMAETGFSDRDSDVMPELNSSFEKNKALLGVFSARIWQGNYDQLSCIINWEENCRYLMNKIPSFREYCTTASLVIYQHLGLNGNWLGPIYVCYKLLQVSKS